jgi:hypothetical protein
MTKRGKLEDALLKAANDEPAKDTIVDDAARPRKRKTGKVLVGALFDPAVRRQLKVLEAETDQNLQEVLSEAINDLFVKYRKNPIA